MTIKHIFFAALTAVLAASCANDDSANGSDNGQDAGKVKVTLTASTPETRVGMTKTSTSQASLYWQSGDSILVQTVTNSTYSGAKLTAADNTKTGSKSATFTGEVETDTELGTYAVYPYNENHSFTGEKTLTYNLPATYTYSTVGSKIFSKTVDEETTYPSNNTNLPMLGTISNNTVTFKMLGGMAVIRIDSMPAATGTIKVTANQQLSGNFTVADLSATDASIATSATTLADSTVTFTFSSATIGSAGVFYLPLATGSYTNLTIAVTCNNATQTINYDTLSVDRCDVKAIALTTNDDGNLMYIEKLEDNKYKINGHVFVDLGLSSGLLWAETNIGATSSTEAGYYFAWGETTTKTDYSDANYSSTLKSKYPTNSSNTLKAEDDAATANWGAGVRMPTGTEFQEIMSSCTWTWDATKTGWLVTSKADGNTNSIFLFRAPYYNGTTLSFFKGDRGYYWTSSGNTSKAGYVGLDPTTQWYEVDSGYYGYPVRPVATLPSSMK